MARKYIGDYPANVFAPLEAAADPGDEDIFSHLPPHGPSSCSDAPAASIFVALNLWLASVVWRAQTTRALQPIKDRLLVVEVNMRHSGQIHTAIENFDAPSDTFLTTSGVTRHQA